MKAELYPELGHAPETDATLDALILGAQEALHNIDISSLYRLATRMNHGVAAVVETGGRNTKY
jgi:hypothetical protein